MAKHEKINFRAYHIASATLKAVSLQLNGMLMKWKIQQATQEDTIRTDRIHPACVHFACSPVSLGKAVRGGRVLDPNDLTKS